VSVEDCAERIEKLAMERFEAFERAFLIRPHQPRIPRDIGGEDRGEATGLAHPSGIPALRKPSAWIASGAG